MTGFCCHDTVKLQCFMLYYFYFILSLKLRELQMTKYIYVKYLQNLTIRLTNHLPQNHFYQLDLDLFGLKFT